MFFCVSGILVFIAEVPNGGAGASPGREAFLGDVLQRLERRYARSFHLHDEGSRPRLGADEGYLSLSHSRHWIGLAYSALTPVGFDLEEKARRLVNAEAIVHRFFTPEDRQALGPTPTDEQILQLWTRKEALLKAEGRGLHEEISAHGHLPLRDLEAKWRVHMLTNRANFPTALLGSVASPSADGPLEIIRVLPPKS